MAEHLFSRGSRAQNQRLVRLQTAENALGQLDSGEGDRHGPGADLGLGAHALAHFEGALEHAVEHRTGAAMVEGDAIGLAHLSQNFGLAQHHGVQASGDAEEVAHGFAIVPAVEAVAEGCGLDLVECGQEKLDGPGAVLCRLRGRFRGNAVEFAAIARGEHQRLGKNAARTQLFRGQASVLARERNALAQLDRGGAVIQAYENNLHSLVSSPYPHRQADPAEWSCDPAPIRKADSSSQTALLGMTTGGLAAGNRHPASFPNPLVPNSLVPNRRASKVPVKTREVQIHHAIAEQHKEKIDHAEHRGPRASPGPGPPQP